MINIDGIKQQRRLEKTNIRTFKANFGKHPIHLCRVWRDLQLTTIPDAHMTEAEARSKDGLKGFLMACNMLKVYSSIDNRAALFQGEDPARVGTLSWRFTFRIAALREMKVVWPVWNETLVASVDGTQCQTNEPRDPNMRKNPRNYSHKFHLPGRNHEIAIDLWQSRCVHCKVSDRASVPDLTAFRQELRGKMAPGKRLIADKGYISFRNNEHDIIAFPNPLDTPAVKDFKDRARARHETFNKRLKDFKCLKHSFTQGVDKQQACFFAAVVLTQYAIEDTGPFGEPLFSL